MDIDNQPLIVNIIVERETGLHVRPSGEIAASIDKLECDVFLECRGTRVNAKSIMGLLTLAAEKGATVQVEALGPDAQKAVKIIEAILKNGKEK